MKSAVLLLTGILILSVRSTEVTFVATEPGALFGNEAQEFQPIIPFMTPHVWDQSGSPQWNMFRTVEKSYGFEVEAANDNPGVTATNRAVGYPFVQGPLNDLWFKGTVTIIRTECAGGAWMRCAFVLAVDLGDHEDYLELEVYDSPQSPVQVGKVFLSRTVREYSEFQLQAGETKGFAFNMVEKYRQFFPERSCSGVLRVHSYFVLETFTPPSGSWHIHYKIENMGLQHSALVSLSTSSQRSEDAKVEDEKGFELCGLQNITVEGVEPLFNNVFAMTIDGIWGGRPYVSATVMHRASRPDAAECVLTSEPTW